MTLQMRPRDPVTGEGIGVHYAPGRDIVYLYPHVVEKVEQQLYLGAYAPLAEWLKEKGVTEDEMAETVRCYCLFLNAAHKNPEQSVEDVLHQCGFIDCSEPAQIAFMFYIGTIMTATFFKGIRDVVELGAETTPEVKGLLSMTDRVSRYFRRGPVGRWWARMKAKWYHRHKRYTLGGYPN